MVPDTQCLGCHEAITEHVPDDHHSLAELASIRCATCHKEHNEPATLVVEEQALCVDCHGDLGASGGDVGGSL